MTIKNQNKYQFNEIACDAGVLIELVQEGMNLPLFQEINEGRVNPKVTILALTELQYILCRKIGTQKSEEKVSALIDSNYFEISFLNDLRSISSTLKCQRAISLPDCFTIALAITRSIPALFATREKELDREIKKKPFQVQILFLDEL
jgi:hypothetical protein